MATELWAMKTERTLTAAEEARYLSLLPQARRERLLRMKRPEKRREILCAYGLLHAAVQARCPQMDRLPDMEYGPLGKPAFLSCPDLCFNLSHTDGAVLVGVSDAPVGVDIERIRPVSEGMRKRLGGGALEEIFEIWTRREARAKRLGTAVALREELPPGPEETVFSPAVFCGFAVCACMARGEAADVFCITMDDLAALEKIKAAER